MNELSIAVLVDDAAGAHGLRAEHGLALWAQWGERRVLFDTGQTDIVRHNARGIGIDLASADAIVLSHGHYDHTGGLAWIVDPVGETPVFAHPDALANKYVEKSEGRGRDVGIAPRSRIALQKHDNLTMTEKPTEIGDGMCVTGPIPRLTGFGDTGAASFRDEACREPDALIDDQALFLDTPEGVVVIIGCAHSGIINTLMYVQELLPGRPIHAVVGGTHLVSADENRMDRTIESLRQMNIRRLVPLHCTGLAAVSRLQGEFPGRVSACRVGSMIEL